MKSNRVAKLLAMGAALGMRLPLEGHKIEGPLLVTNMLPDDSEVRIAKAEAKRQRKQVKRVENQK